MTSRHRYGILRRAEHLVARRGVHDRHSKGHFATPPRELREDAQALEQEWVGRIFWDANGVEYTQNE